MQSRKPNDFNERYERYVRYQDVKIKKPNEKQRKMKKPNNINERYRLVREVFQNKVIPNIRIITILTN